MKNKALRKGARIALPFVLIPLAAIFGTAVFDEKRHIFISLFVALMSLLLFAAGFEKRETGSRRAVICSVMIALSVVGRMIPLFKPVTALTVIGGIYMGGEAGFLIGSLSALLSNFIFGQGPWTPFQMLGWGIIGLLAGYMGKLLKGSRAALIFYGVVSGLIFSLVMDVWTVLWYNGSFSAPLYLAAMVSALPHTLLYAVSNGIFLYFLGKPFGDKLERIKIKYGI